MSCTNNFDLRDYFFGELPEAERALAERHVKSCEECSAELEQLAGIRGTLMTLRDEEMPRRIGFVSDKIFEPSPFRRWLSSFWLSGARLGFASAAMLSVALLVFAARTQPKVIEHRVEVAAAAPQVDIEAAVAKAVSAAMVQQEQKTKALLAVSERKHEEEKRETLVMLSDYTLNVDKRIAANKVAINFALEGAQH